jgi:DNA replication and repair protein RecF
VHLRQLALANFRNYVRLGLDLPPGVSVLCGANGQGKSNLLEAIHVLATTRSPRAGTERELVNWGASEGGAPFARLEARVVRSSGELHVELLLRSEAPDQTANGSPSSFSRAIKVNGLPCRAAQLVGQINVVLFSPEDVALAGGPPAGRRRYLDITNSQVNPAYLRALQRYNRVLVQRNHLLRQIRERRQPREMLEPWDQEQVDLGSQVLAQRLAMIRSVNSILAERYRQLSGSQQELQLAYTATALAEGWADLPTEALTEAFQRRVREVHPRERELAVTLVGPHRDDFSFRLDDVDLNTYGSRGQQRLAVLALKLAESEYMQAETGERPVLLLDDVLSELDPARRQFVLERALTGGQVLITTTNRADLSPAFVADAAFFQVSAGTVGPLPDEQVGETEAVRAQS